MLYSNNDRPAFRHFAACDAPCPGRGLDRADLAGRVVGVVITLTEVSCRQGPLLAVDHISASFGPGLTAIAGPNGAGKTTLLRAMAGLHKLSGGAISGQTGPRQIALLPQAGGVEFAGVYLMALAAGVSIASCQRNLDPTHLLFGSVLAVDDSALVRMACVSSLALLGLAVIWRPRILESLDPGFLRAQGGRGGVWHASFMALVVLCVVGGFAALGTLMSVGLTLLPAIASRHWSARLGGQMAAAVVVALPSSAVGLLLSFHTDLPAGPAILLVAGGVWLASVVAGPHDSLISTGRRV